MNNILFLDSVSACEYVLAFREKDPDLRLPHPSELTTPHRIISSVLLHHPNVLECPFWLDVMIAKIFS